MELLQGLTSRRSVRGFKSTPVPQQTLRAILQAAIHSPSYTNTQPWAGTPSSADVPAPTQWPEALANRAAEHSARRFRVLGIERDDAHGRNELRLQNYRFFGAPCVIFLFLDSTLGAWSTFDLGLFAQTLALAAHGWGLGTCLQASVTHYPDAVRGFLGLPQSKKLVLGISLGYPDPAARINSYQSARADLDEVVKWYG